MNENDAIMEKKDISFIKKELKEKYPDVKYPPYMAEYVLYVVNSGLSLSECARRIGKGRSTIKNHRDDNIKEYIEELKSERITQMGQKMYGFLSKAMAVYEDLIDNSENDSVRLKAAETILKKFRIIEEKTKLEHSGILTIEYEKGLDD